MSAAPVACLTCADLGWPSEADHGLADVCAESDDGFECTSNVAHAAAEQTCAMAGARLCSADELFAGAGMGTGCSHDYRAVWSSSTEMEGLSCQWNEAITIFQGEGTCTNVADDFSDAAVRCCADTTCGGDLQPNIVQLGAALPQFSTLVAALQATAGGDTDLVSVLSGPGPFTVFAPTNDAFDGVDVAGLLANNDALVDTLTYHVVAGEIFSSDLTSGMQITTVEGKKLTVRISSFGGINRVSLQMGSRDDIVAAAGQIESASITQADVLASNGVLHVIDTVLIPPAQADCATCDSLGWPTAGGSDAVCAESDDGFDCTNTVTYTDADRQCSVIGARLCTADELVSGEGTGSGCGHDGRYIWSSSSTCGSLLCPRGQMVAVIGRATAGQDPMCLDTGSSGGSAIGDVSLRCCADTTCSSGQAADQTTVYIINAAGQCGESTFPSTWADAALAWVATQRMTVTVGNCASQGYTVPAGSQIVPGTGAPSDPVVTLYTDGGH